MAAAVTPPPQPQLQHRRWRLCKSAIHGWGLLASEPIGPDELVMEYCGERIRSLVADVREQRYQALGRFNYMFRVDADTVRRAFELCVCAALFLKGRN